MTPGQMGFVIGFIITAALALNFVLARVSRRRPAMRPQVPEFLPRHAKPRAVTRLHKDNLTWEI